MSCIVYPADDSMIIWFFLYLLQHISVSLVYYRYCYCPQRAVVLTPQHVLCETQRTKSHCARSWEWWTWNRSRLSNPLLTHILTYLLTTWSRVLQKLTGPQLDKKFPHFMEPDGSLPHLQVPTTCPYPEPAWSSLIPPHPTSWKSIFILSSHLLGSSKWSLSLRFPHQNPIYASPLLHTWYMPCPSHYSQFYHLHNIGWVVQIIKLLIM